MAGLKSIARLGSGWLLMLAGMALLLESGVTLRPGRKTLAAAEALAGFALAVTGWLLRRAAIRPGNPQ